MVNKESYAPDAFIAVWFVIETIFSELAEVLLIVLIVEIFLSPLINKLVELIFL